MLHQSLHQFHLILALNSLKLTCPVCQISENTFFEVFGDRRGKIKAIKRPCLAAAAPTVAALLAEPD